MIALSDLKRELDAPDEDLALIQQMEQRAVVILEQLTQRYLGEPAQVIEFVNGGCSRTLWLDEEPAASPAPVVEHETSPGTWETVDAADYEFRGRELVNNVTRWSAGRANYRVTYTRGFEAGSEPEEIRQAVILLVGRLYSERGADALQSETIGGYSYTRRDREMADAVLTSLGIRPRWVCA